MEGDSRRTSYDLEMGYRRQDWEIPPTSMMRRKVSSDLPTAG